MMSCWNDRFMKGAMVGIFVAGAMYAHMAQAQGNTGRSFRLMVRPHEMTLGTRNEAGQQRLNALGDSVYVPASAAGTRKVPLVLSFSGDNITRWRSMAEQYGTIFVTLRETMGGDNLLEASQLQVIDDVLQKVLSTYAVDPDKIALLGMSNGGRLAITIGCQNLDIFSRIGLISPIPGWYPTCVDTTRPAAKQTQFFVTTGTGEPNITIAEILEMAPPMRRDGHPVQLGLNLRFHQSRRKDYGALWQWLTDGWGASTTQALTSNVGVTPLTTAALTQMTTLWTDVRKKHPKGDLDADAEMWPPVNEKTVVIPVGTEQMAVYDMTDLRSIAAKDPSVSATLKKAKLSFQQEENYRAAFIGAYATMRAQEKRPTLAADSKVQHNVTFFKAHTKEANALMDLMGVPRCEAGFQEQYAPGSCVTN